MKNNHIFSPPSRVDAFSRAVVARLSQSTEQLPHNVTERLRAARMQALAGRRTEPVRLAHNVPAWVPQGVTAGVQSGAGTGGGTGRGSGFGGLWGKLAAVLPLVVLLAGLVSINAVQQEMRADELAQVDAELLLDELPPAAYVDPGFVQFLRANQAQ